MDTSTNRQLFFHVHDQPAQQPFSWRIFEWRELAISLAIRPDG